MGTSITVQGYIDQLALRFDSAGLFYGHGTDNSYDEAVYLVFTLLDIGFDQAVDLDALELDTEQVERLDKVCDRRVHDQIPVAYLVGQAWFAGHKFFSDERALVPRSPIAELILHRFSGLLDSDPERILDMCTGSGCIGIAAALEYPLAQVDLADVSSDALDLANSNIQLHDLQGRVATICSDGFAEVRNCYDLILCNPPYVSAEEYADLPREYLAEPALGLVSENEGLALPIKLLEQSAEHLTADGLLIMEVGFSEKALIRALPKLPFLWLEFEHGGSGVFCLRAEQLRGFSAIGK